MTNSHRGTSVHGAMLSPINVDVMMIGHFAKDRLLVNGHKELASGGAVYYGGIVLRRMGISVAVVTRLHPNDFPRLDELRREGVQILATPAPETSAIEIIYTSADMERRICKLLSFAGLFQVTDIPDVAARIYAIVPIIGGEADLTLLKTLAARGPVALDVQGFVRARDGDELVPRRWPEMEEGLSCVTYLKADRAEAELLTGLADMAAAARCLADYGPREVVVTESSGVTVFADGSIYQAPFTSRSLAGRTGRGDTCFATYLGRRLTASPEEATRLAAAVTTLKQEQPGPWRGALTAIAENANV